MVFGEVWGRGAGRPRTAPDCRGHHNASLDSGHPVLKNNSWPISNIAQAQGQCEKPHFDISSSSSPKAPAPTVHPWRSQIGVGGGCPTNLPLLQVFPSLPLLELSRGFWNVHQEPEQMFCKINLSTYRQNINTYKRLVSFSGLRMKAQHYSNTLQWKMHKVVKRCWYQESAGDSVQLSWMLSRGSQLWAWQSNGL